MMTTTGGGKKGSEEEDYVGDDCHGYDDDFGGKNDGDNGDDSGKGHCRKVM